MTRRIPLLAVSVLMLGPLAACGGDDSDTAGDSASTETPSESSGTSADSPETEGADPESTESPESSTASGDDLTAAEQTYCDEVAGARKELSGAGGGGLAVGAAVQALQDITRLAPPDVRPAWESLSSTAATVQKVVSKAGLRLEDLENPESLGGLSSKQQRILTEGLSDLDIADLQQDSETITEQVGKLCGLQLSPGASP